MASLRVTMPPQLTDVPSAEPNQYRIAPSLFARLSSLLRHDWLRSWAMPLSVSA